MRARSAALRAPLHGVRLEEAGLDDWWAAAKQGWGLTYFHGPEWSLVWQAWSPRSFRPAPARAVLSGGEPVLLGITRQRTRLGRVIHHLSPAGTYGGWIAPEPLDPSATAAVEGAIRGLGRVVWRRSPWPPGCPIESSGAETTQLIDLSGGAEAARARWRGSARRRVHRALSVGVQVRPGVGDADWARYLSLYRASLERWGRPSTRYPGAFFRALRLFGGPGVRLWIAELEGELAAAAIVLVRGDHAAYWAGASEPGRAPGAANLLHWQVIGALAAEGVKVYDLNPSGGHPGVERFKRSLGAESVPAPLVELHRQAVGGRGLGGILRGLRCMGVRHGR